MISLFQGKHKDRNHRAFFKATETSRRYYKFLKFQGPKLGFVPLSNLPPIKIRNYCLVSGKARGIYSKRIKLSRHQLKKYFSYLKSIRNSSW